jgi:hypothetical protein
MTESADDFASLRAELEEEIKPRGIIERLYVDDFAIIVWEIQRLRRCKTAIINGAFRPAVTRRDRAIRWISKWRGNSTNKG